jgi:hypothetical protein
MKKSRRIRSMSEESRCEILVEVLLSEFPIASVLKSIVQTIEENRGYEAFNLKQLAENLESAVTEYEDNTEQDSV